MPRGLGSVNTYDGRFGYGPLVGPIRVVSESVPYGTQGIPIYSGSTQGLHKEAPASVAVGFVGFREATQEDEDSEVLDRCLIEGANSPLTIGRHIVAALWSCDVGDEHSEWKSPLWDFVWRLKMHPRLLAYGATKALRSVERTAVKNLKELFCDLDLDEIREDFQVCWEKQRLLPGWGLLEHALAMAGEHPLAVQPEQRRSASYERFISYAGWLQVCRGNKPVILPCWLTAELMFGSDSKRMRISRYIGWAIKDGYLKRVFVGSLKSRQADAFRFAVGRWACLEQKARPGCAEAFDRAEHRRRLGGRGREDSNQQSPQERQVTDKASP